MGVVFTSISNRVSSNDNDNNNNDKLIIVLIKNGVDYCIHCLV